MPTPSTRISQISASGSDMEGWEVYVEAIRRKRAGEDIMMVCIGDHDFKTPQASVDNLKDILDDGPHGYSDMPGIPPLREAMAKCSTEACGVDVSPSEIVAVPGGQAGLYACLQATIDPGDHVIIISPYYVTYPNTVRGCGGTFTLVEASPDDGFEPRAEAIEAAIRPNTKAVMINTPNNPTCAIYSRETLEKIAKVCMEHDLWLISDEVYWSLSNGLHVSPIAIEGMRERTLVVHSMSKSHGMTGWRMGWVVATGDMAWYLTQQNLVSTYGMNSFLSRALAISLDQRIGVDEIAETYRNRGLAFAEALEGANGVRLVNKPGSMYFMIDIRDIARDAQKFAFGLLAQENVAVMPGDSFGPSAAGHLRLSLCVDEDNLREVATRLRRFASTYKE